MREGRGARRISMWISLQQIKLGWFPGARGRRRGNR
jgi:hypothetical protein